MPNLATVFRHSSDVNIFQLEIYFIYPKSVQNEFKSKFMKTWTLAKGSIQIAVSQMQYLHSSILYQGKRTHLVRIPHQGRKDRIKIFRNFPKNLLYLYWHSTGSHKPTGKNSNYTKIILSVGSWDPVECRYRWGTIFKKIMVPFNDIWLIIQNKTVYK